MPRDDATNLDRVRRGIGTGKVKASQLQLSNGKGPVKHYLEDTLKISGRMTAFIESKMSNPIQIYIRSRFL